MLAGGSTFVQLQETNAVQTDHVQFAAKKHTHAVQDNVRPKMYLEPKEQNCFCDSAGLRSIHSFRYGRLTKLLT